MDVVTTPMQHSDIPATARAAPVRAWRRALASFRVQFALLIVGGLFAPLLIRRGATAAEMFEESYTLVTMSAIAGAIFAALIGVRRFGRFPGTSAVAYVVPAFAITYAVAIAIMFALRLDYSISLLAISFPMTLLIAFYATAYADPGDRLFYVVPSPQAGQITSVGGAVWITMAEARLPAHPAVAIVADLHEDLTPEWERMLADAALSGRPVYHYKQLAESLTGRVQIEHLSENSFGSLLPNLAYRKVKRLVDVGFCLAMLPFAALPMLAAAIAIRFETPGPIFFRQQRMGYQGRPFSVIKFRTMHVQQPDEQGEHQRRGAMTAENDPRITPLGRFLRRSRIDELPQLFNVLAGDMSLIGPRPEAMTLSDWYESELPFYRYRHIVRPGISGWAQVNQGHVAEIEDVTIKLHYDFYYIKNFSMWLDILITLRTIRTIFSGFGAR